MNSDIKRLQVKKGNRQNNSETLLSAAGLMICIMNCYNRQIKALFFGPKLSFLFTIFSNVTFQ